MPISLSAENPLNCSRGQLEAHQCLLSNGVKLHCISHPQFSFTTVGVEVQAGSWHDPKPHLRVAHLMEHLFLMGVREFAGKEACESGTEPGRTYYCFSTAHQELKELLCSIVVGLNTHEISAEELKAACGILEEESAPFQLHDAISLHRMLQLHADPHHPFSQDSMGDLEQLSQLLPELLTSWKQAHYRPDALHITIASALPISTVEAMVKELFQTYPASQTVQPPQKIDSSPFAKQQWHSHVSSTESASGEHVLTLAWEIACDHHQASLLTLTQALAALFGEEGTGSLYADYADKGWALSVESDVTLLPNKALLLTVKWVLTEKGFKRDEEIVQGVMESLERWRISGIPNYYLQDRKKYETLKALQSPLSNSYDLVQELLVEGSKQKEEEKEEEFSVESWRRLCAQVRPETMHVVCMAPKEALKQPLAQQDPKTHSAYATQPFSKRQRQKWCGAGASKLERIPSPNPWMPHLLVKERLFEEPLPSLEKVQILSKGERGVFYHLPLSSEALSGSWRLRWGITKSKTELEHLYRMLLLETMQIAFSARFETVRRAGIAQKLLLDETGAFCIELSGYPERLFDCMQAQVEEISRFSPSLDAFLQAKQRLIARLQEKMRGGDYSAQELLDQACHRQMPCTEQIACLKKVALEELASYLPLVTSSPQIELIGVSPLSERRCMEGWNILQTQFKVPVAQEAAEEKATLSAWKSLDAPCALQLRIPQEGHRLVWMVQVPSQFIQNSAQKLLISRLWEYLFEKEGMECGMKCGIKLYPHYDENSEWIVCSMQSSLVEPQELLSSLERAIVEFLQQETQEIQGKSLSAIVFQQENKPLTPLGVCHFVSHALTKKQGNLHWKEHDSEKGASLQLGDYQTYIKAVLGVQNSQRMAFLFQGKKNNNFCNYRTVRSWKALWKL